MKSHNYTVEFRIYGKELDPASVTKEFGLHPCQSYLLGSKIGKKVRDRSMWAYNGSEDSPVLDWDTLEEGLKFILDKLWPFRPIIESYREKNQLILWCGQFQSSLDGGPSFSPELLKRLGDFGVELFIDCYFIED